MHVLTVNIRVKTKTKAMRTKPKENESRAKIQQLNLKKKRRKEKEGKMEKNGTRGVVTEKISLCTSSFGFIAVVETSRRGRQSIAIAYMFVAKKLNDGLRSGRYAGKRVRGEEEFDFYGTHTYASARVRDPLAAEYSRRSERDFPRAGASYVKYIFS
jgi:hypothetical protein